MRLVLLLLLAVLALGACGLKGPLYLPAEKADARADTATPPGTKK
jgi:predicted small lipoprotein YifL